MIYQTASGEARLAYDLPSSLMSRLDNDAVSAAGPRDLTGGARKLDLELIMRVYRASSAWLEGWKMHTLPMFELSLLFVLTSVPALAQSAIDGTWKADLSTAQMPSKPDVFLLQDGMYHCKTCVPPIDIKADGQPQKVAGHPYFDAVSIKVVDDRSIAEADSKDGKVVSTSTMVVAPDGNTGAFAFRDSSATSGAPITGRGEVTRVAKGPAGSHAISGSWRTSKIADMSENGTTITYKLDGDVLAMSTPSGQSYSAKLDGTDAPYNGDPGTTSVSVKRAGKNGYEETDKRAGKVTSVAHFVVAPDGKTMTVSIDDKLRGATTQFVLDKQ